MGQAGHRALTLSTPEGYHLGSLTSAGPTSSSVVSRCLTVVCATLLLAACSESTLVSPTAPTSPSAEKVPALSIACPADMFAVSPTGVPIPVSFGSPVVQGGLAPLTSGCDPASGTSFSVGQTTVSCDAQDALQQAVSCTLSVSVQESLGIVRIVAFGDSITSGLMSDLIEALGRVQLATSFDPTKAYPARLQARLQQRFGAGSIEVLNEGQDGERALNALPRLTEVLATLHPDTVLLMEGTNDLFSNTSPAALMGVAAAMENQVIEARRQGVDPILATIPPQRGTPQRFLPPTLSDFLRDVAVRQNVPLVDIYTLLNEAQCMTLPALRVPALRLPTLRAPTAAQGACIGDDGVHPTAEGYELMANEFFDRILGVYGAAAVPTASSRMRALFESRGY